MATITEQFGTGHSNLAPQDAQGAPNLASALRDVADDFTAIRAAFVALTAKLDTDFTAQNIAVTSSQLDEDYAATLDPAALLTIKG